MYAYKDIIIEEKLNLIQQNQIGQLEITLNNKIQHFRQFMIENKSDRQLSPINKDKFLIGRFIKTKKLNEQNPQTNFNQQYDKSHQNNDREKSPKSIGINTSKTNLPKMPIITVSKNNQDRNNESLEYNLINPITHIKDRKSIFNVSNNKQSRYLQSNSIENQSSTNFATNCNFQAKQSQNQTYRNDIPAIVNFPEQYHQNQVGSIPDTPDLPNRISFHSQDQNVKQSPIILTKQFQDKTEVGMIRHQKGSRIFSNSAPKDFGSTVSQNNLSPFSSPQLPSINKINNNIQGFRKFVNGSSSFISQKQLKSSNNFFQIGNKYNNNIPQFTVRNKNFSKNVLNKSIGEIFRKQSSKNDPEQQQKLSQKKNFRVSTYAVKQKLPTFRQQNVEQFQQQVNFQKPLPTNLNNKRSNNNLNLNQSNFEQLKNLEGSSMNNNIKDFPQDTQLEPGTLFTNSFIRNTTHTKSQNLVIIDLRTSIQKIKQVLIEGDDCLAVSFDIPQIFYHPPSPQTSSQQLHLLMLRVFSHVGINPQIVSIKKYINCVVMRDKKLCLMWNFNGKVYFGGWKKQQTMAEGNKDGVGVQWVPSRYIYYGQFKDNKKEGYGLMKKSNKQIYIGCWKNNHRWGWGKVYDANGFLNQNGEFIQGRFIYERKSQYQLLQIQGKKRHNQKFDQ